MELDIFEAETFLKNHGWHVYPPCSKVPALIEAAIQFDTVPRRKSYNELTEELHAAARVVAEEMKK